jgi:predicted amidohydrolase YtcJ
MPPRPATELVPLRSLVDAGVPVALGSDNAPVSMFYPIWEAVARRCSRCGGRIGAEEALSRHEALYAATMGGAYICKDETNRGSIEPGKLADIAVLSADPLSVSEDSLRDIFADLTIVGGKVVYRRYPAADQFQPLEAYRSP